MREERLIRSVRLLWPLLLGMGLALALLWGLIPRSAVKAQAVNSGLSVNLVHERVRIAPRGAYGAVQADVPVWTNALDATPPAPWRDDPIRATVPRSVAAARAGRAVYALLAPTPAITVLLTSDAVWGFVTANSEVSVTLGDGSGPKGLGLMRSDAVGYFYVQPYDDGSVADIAGGNTVTVTVGGITTTIINVPTITVTVNVGTDVVSATIGGSTPGFGLQLATLGRVQAVVAAGDGAYSADFSATSDLTHLDIGSALYTDAAGNSIVADGRPQDGMVVNETYDYAIGYTTPGSVVTVTQNQAGSIVSSTVTANRPSGQWYWYSSGILAGDVITVELGGTVISTTVSLITGSVDVSANTVLGAGPTASSITAGLWRDGVRHDYVVPTDPSDGSYTATFTPEGIHNGEIVYLYHHDNAAADTLVYAREPHILLYLNWNEVDAFIGQGSAAVTATLRSGAGVVKEQQTGTSNGVGWFWTSFDESMEPGDTVGVIGGALSDTVTVVTLTLSLDVDANTMSGLAPANADLELRLYRDGLNFGQSGLYTSTALGDGTFSFDAGEFQDIHNGFYGYVYVRQNNDLDDHQIVSYGPAAHLIADETQNGADGRVPDINAPVTITLLAADNSVKSVRTQTSSGSGWASWVNFDTDVIPTDKVRFESPSLSQTVTVLSVTANIDADTERVTGVGPPNSFLVVNALHAWPPLVVPTDESGNYVADFVALDIDFGPDDRATVSAFDHNWNVSRIVGQVPYARANSEWNSVDGWFGPNVTVNFTVTDALGAYKGSGSGTTRSDGWLDGRGCGCDIAPTDLISVTSDVGFATMMEMITITGQVDVVSDVVSGQMVGGIFPASGDIWLWSDTRQDGYGTSISIDASGFYTADLSAFGIWDGDRAEVWYYDANDNHIGNTLYAPILRMSVNYGHDWVEGNYYEAGHTIWLTVTESDGLTVKATAELKTGAVPWWGGQIGFSTNWHGWSPSQPDLVPGDRVYGLADDGRAASVRIGVINGELDVDADTVSGTIHANWFTQTLNAYCSVWEENGPGQGFSVDPDGGAYLCDFSSQWDLLSGQQVGVQYQEPDGDWVINVFQEPAPDTRVEKWIEGGGEVNPGGTVVYNIRYYNNGEAAATAVVLTDTLPPSTTYRSDSSGFTAYPSGNVVTWSLGTVASRSQAQFHLVLDVDGGVIASDTIASNVITVASGNYEPSYWQGDNRAESGDIHVSDASPDLYVNKYPSPGDPVAGQTILYQIDYGNQGSVSSGPVLLTDTLPLSTTFVNWFSENNYTLWSKVITTGGRFVLSAPTLPGNWGDRIMLRLRISDTVDIGTQLTNTVEITTLGDGDPNNNQDMRNDVWVSSPRREVYVNKNWGWGQLVPGGQINYNINYGNDGNMAAQTWLTDALPAGTTFITSTRWIGYYDVPVRPSYTGAGVVAWDLGVLEPGEHNNLRVHLVVSPTVAPDTVITNCATIAMDQIDSWPYNNTDCAVDTVRTTGANLRVRKESRWDWEGQIRYDIYFENIGTTRMEDVWITDTYPISTTFNDDWWVNHGPWITTTHDAPNRQLIFWAESLDPGNTGSIGFRVDLDGSIHGVQGLIFTNTAQAPWPGDVYPDDNSAVELAYTGPDVYVEKELSGGDPRPGEIVTFSVEFGNRNNWWSGDNAYGSHITDTLPVEMEFVTATNWLPHQLPGNALEWDWGTMWSDSTWYLDIVARITDTVEGGDVITNVIEAYGDSPNDVEPFWDNNVFELPITILNPRFEIGKVYQGQVTGATVTYTLTITNVGSEAGSSVLVTDTVPAYLSDVNVKGGTLNLGWVEWLLGPIAPGGGTAMARFSATLPCRAGLSIVNDDYGVRGSDQGVSGPAGAALSFDTIAPTISVGIAHTPGSIVVSDTVYFTATASSNGTPPGYAWDLGDGSTASGLTTSHVYTQDGSYTVVFTATDACGYSAALTTSVTVDAPDLVAAFEYSPSPANIVVNNTITFTDTSTTAGPPIVAWAWTFGDSGTSNAQNPSHLYTTVGTYTVSLVVTDALGYSDDEVKTNLVVVVPSCVNVTGLSFDYAPAAPVIQSPVVFTASVTGGSTPIAYAWQFDDGGSGSGQTVTHTFTLSGTHTVTVTASNACSAPTYSDTVDVETFRVFLPLVLKSN